MSKSKSTHPEYTQARKEDLATWRIWFRMHQIVQTGEYAYVESSVCEQWHGSEGFLNFLDDMGPKKPGKILARHNKLGDWDPQNCYWADTKKQCQTGRRYIKNVESRRLAEKNGIAYRTWYNRIQTGWDPLDAATLPPSQVPYKKRIT